MTTMATTATAAGLPGGPVSMVAAGLNMTDEMAASNATLAMSPRQQVLDKYWSWYRTDPYAARRVAWDGSEYHGMIEKDAVALAGYVPPGFYIANAKTLPINYRRPDTPYHIVKVIVDRFTAMLFSNKRHPKITVEGDAITEDFLNAVAESGRLWPTMMQARTHGGGMGTAVVGFKLLSGRPVFETFDPRWCVPRFLDRSQLVLESIDYRYVFTQEVRDLKGQWTEVSYWYRRVINRDHDIVFRPRQTDEVMEGRGEWQPAQVVEHGLGFCPVVWIQNTPNTTDLDGDPDAMGVLEMAEGIDRLNSQSDKGTLANCDPTVVIACDEDMDGITKGSESAIKMKAGGTAGYMEMSGSGIDTAMKKIELYKQAIGEVASCVFQLPDRVMTATEVERLMAPMISRADVLREQYGEQGVKRLLNMVCVAAKRLASPLVQNGGIIRRTFTLPMRIEGTGKMAKRIPRAIGDGPYQVGLTWPTYTEPSPQDAGYAVTAATNAKTAGLIDHVTAAKYVASFFGVEDARAMVDAIKRDARADQMELERLAVAGPDSSSSDDSHDDEPTNVQQAALNGAQITGLLTIAEAVQSKAITVEQALAIIEVSFPVGRDEAVRIVGIPGTATGIPPAAPKPVKPATPATPAPGVPSGP